MNTTGAPSATRAQARGRIDWSLAALVAPALVLLLVFYVVPNVLQFFYALTDWSSFRTDVNFTGLSNFEDMLRDGTLVDVVSTTLKYAIFVTVVQNAVSLALALALEKSTRLNLVLRSLLFLPVLLSTLAAGYVAIGILAPDGVANALMSVMTRTLGLGPVEIAWLGSPTWTLFVVGLVAGWKSGGITMLVYIAGLKAIPGDLVEAATIDGASPWQVIRKVKLPLLAPAVTFNVALTLIGALSTFDIVLAMTKGGPARATEVINYVVWKQFGQGFFGYSTAMSLTLTIVIVMIAIPTIMWLRRREVTL
jgi:raffinose/stachyose/melibiose transport system permease protein